MGKNYHSDTMEQIEVVTYSPGLKDSGDLEAATRAITRISEAPGTGNADYSCSLSLPRPGDGRLVVKAIGARLAVTIDGFAGASVLYGRVYVDQQDADHRLFDVSWNSTGAKVEATYKSSGTVFALISDGAAHTFYFFFWVDAGSATISLVELWEGVGTGNVGANGYTCLELSHTGLVQVSGNFKRAGTGTAYLHCMTPSAAAFNTAYASSGLTINADTCYLYLNTWGLIMAKDTLGFVFANAGVITDLQVVNNLVLRLRSEA